MDVTRKNFRELLPAISTAINEASFVAIDGEFTGLSLQGNTIHGLDLPGERYDKLRKSVGEFLLIQFGMCTFAWDEENAKYISRAFNFYICPKPFSRQATDRRFSCQSSSLEFLALQGFDFNKVFRQGIAYITPAEEERLRTLLEEKHRCIDEQGFPSFTSPATDLDTSIGKGPPIVPEEHKQFLDSICDKIDEFLKTEEKELALLPVNGYLRKLIYQVTKTRFPEEILIETRTNEKKIRYQVVTRVCGEEEMKLQLQKKRQKEYAELEDAVGFTKVIKMLSQSGKVIVGHNMLMDLLYTISQFLSPLPEDYDEFKMLVQCTFPRIVDTKLVSSSEPFKDLIINTALGDLQKRLEEEPFKAHAPPVEHAGGFPSYNTNKEKLHEAGYDAYITGLAYATMLRYNHGSLRSFENKLHLMRLYDVPYMNLAGKDVTPNRDHVFHVTFPSSWKYQDLLQLFSPLGNVSVNWLDDTSAFVSLFRKDLAPQVLRQIKSTEVYRIVTYKHYRQMCHGDQPGPSAGDQQARTASHHVTPTQPMADRKRKMPISDVELDVPEKRRSRDFDISLGDSRNSTFDTIPEETEEVKYIKNVPKLIPDEEDLGVPVSPKRQKTKVGAENEFEVPDAW